MVMLVVEPQQRLLLQLPTKALKFRHTGRAEQFPPLVVGGTVVRRALSFGRYNRGSNATVDWSNMNDRELPPCRARNRSYCL